MHCLYCQKRLWRFFSKERLFCSKSHEIAHREELSAIESLIEFVSRPEPPAPPAPPARRNRSLALIHLRNKVPTKPVNAVPRVSNFLAESPRPKPIAPGPPVTRLLETIPFAGTIRFPSTNLVGVPFNWACVTEPAGEIDALPDVAATSRRAPPKRGRRAPSRNKAASGSRKKRGKAVAGPKASYITGANLTIDGGTNASLLERPG